MPTIWTGTTEERFARLEHANRRCDGNSRRCVHAATVSYDLRPARDGQPIPDATIERKLSCSRHVQQFINSANWVVQGSRRLSNKRASDKPHPHTIY